MLNRRDAMMRLGQMGLGALSLTDLVRAEKVIAARALEIGLVDAIAADSVSDALRRLADFPRSQFS